MSCYEQLDFAVIGADAHLMSELIDAFGGDEKMKTHLADSFRPPEQNQWEMNEKIYQWVCEKLIPWCWSDEED